MRRFGVILVCLLVCAASATRAGTYTLTDGSAVTGVPEGGQARDGGVLFKLADGSTRRISWDLLTQDDLTQLLKEDPSKHDQGMIRPLIENSPVISAKLRQIAVTPITPPERPLHGAGIVGLFSSPVGLFLLFALYCGNLYAAYEIALFRNQPLATVCGLAAIPFLGVASPIIYISMPSKPLPADATPEKAPAASVPIGAAGVESSEQPLEEHPQGSSYAAEAPPPAEAPKLPEPIVFSKADFLFNRRFFETKFAGFFRLVPAEADKDLVLLVKSNRGDFIGRRITRVTTSDLYLQIFNENATADEMIPIMEITEVQIRHKDSV